MSDVPPKLPITPPGRSPFVWLVGPKVRSRGIVPTSVPRRDRGALYIFEWAAITIVIGIILTIALPSYRKAMGAAHAVACSSNLQHLYQMTSMYAQDFDGVYPPLPAFPDLETATRPIQQDENAWTDRLSPYREDRKKEKQDPFVCPAADDMMTYSYNAAFGKRIFPEYDPKSQAIHESEIKVPTQTYMVWDTANRAAANALTGYRYFSGRRSDGKYHPGDLVLPTRGVADWMYPRHNGSVSVLFSDGHISRISDPNVRMDTHRNPFDPLADVAMPNDAEGAPTTPAPAASASPSPVAP